MNGKSLIISGTLLASAITASTASPIIFEATGANPAAITPTRDSFRAGVGGGSVAGANGDFGGVRREVCLAYVQSDIQTGDFVVVHVGFAISRVDEAEARRTFEVLREMSQLDELEWMEEPAAASLDAMSPQPQAGAAQ